MRQAQVNQIGIDAEKAQVIADSLNEVLSAYQIHYQNLRGFHWNVKGHRFFELHQKFEEMYEEAKNNIDEVAERILTLGFTPLHTLSDYLQTSGMEEAKNVHNDKETVKYTVEDLQRLLEKERSAWQQASEVADVGTTKILEDYIGSQEKNIWMLNSWLNKSNSEIA